MIPALLTTLTIGVVILVVVVLTTPRRQARFAQRPTQQLAHAVRLLDRILSADSVMPSIPTTLSDEARAFTEQYYRGQKKEIE